MITRMVGAAARAFLVTVMVGVPSLLLPGAELETNQMVALIALLLALLTFVEYVSDSPSLIEFRSAPPFNRTRFFSLFLSVLLLTLILRDQIAPTLLTGAVAGLAAQSGQVLDFPFSPVRLLLLGLEDTTPTLGAGTLRSLAGSAFAISLSMLALFFVMIRVFNWPLRSGAFNFWINLPLYDPTAGGDILKRLKRDAHVNLALGFLLPFLIPAALKAVSGPVLQVSLTDPQTVIWTVSIWAFLPLSLMMRGMALVRIANLIEEKRRRAYRQADLQAA